MNVQTQSAELETMHPQVHIKVDKWEADVDEQLAPLLVELWKADWLTCKSCQAHGPSKKVWVEFAFAFCAEQFLTAIRMDPEPAFDGDDADLGTLSIRSRDWRFDQDFRRSRPGFTAPIKGWEYHVGVQTDVDFDDTGAKSGTGETFFSVSVLFPPRDLPLVLERMRAHNIAVLGESATCEVPESDDATPP